MAEVALHIGGRTHQIACRDGEEDHLRHLGAMLEKHWPVAVQGAGGATGERAFLLLSLILADQLDEADRRPAGERDNAAMSRIADRLEAVANTLENEGANA